MPLIPFGTEQPPLTLHVSLCSGDRCSTDTTNCWTFLSWWFSALRRCVINYRAEVRWSCVNWQAVVGRRSSHYDDAQAAITSPAARGNWRLRRVWNIISELLWRLVRKPADLFQSVSSNLGKSAIQWSVMWLDWFHLWWRNSTNMAWNRQILSNEIICSCSEKVRVKVRVEVKANFPKSSMTF